MQFGKNILIGVTGGIAAYKMPDVSHALKKAGFNVNVILTKNAQYLVTPLPFETLTGNKCIIDMFERELNYSPEHISLAKQSDVVLIAPATANIIGKLANGIADDMLTTTVMACTCPVIIAPAMNHNMYHNPINTENIEKLRRFGYIIIPPEKGPLANGDIGDGRLPSADVLISYVRRAAAKKDLAGKNILVNAGATQESIDPVRFITNHSTGKMGYALAEIAMLRGANVTLVTGKTSLKPPMFVDVKEVVSAQDMFDAVTSLAPSMDIIVKAAAVADYTPAETATEKLKKSDDDMTLDLRRTKDILKYLGEHKPEGQLLCGFAMETENLLENSRRKLASKNLDMICANSLKTAGAGFGTDTNVITLITADSERELPLMSKADAADIIFDTLISLHQGGKDHVGT